MLERQIIGVKGEEIVFYDSIKQASTDLGLQAQNVQACCKGRQKSAGGYKWCYYDPDLPSEKWLYNSDYEIWCSNLGRIKTIRGKSYGGRVTGSYYGYQHNGVKLLVHRIVALTFLPTLNTELYVDHIDGNPSNNNAMNLQWVTPKENIIRYHKLKRKRLLNKF